MTNYIIKVDNREKDLIKLLEIDNIVLENLDIGDIQFVDIDTDEILILIERKTIADLGASIKDGRYKEQKERMLHSIKKSCRKIVLIEGTNMNTFGLPISTMDSVIINTMLRDNIHIHLTNGINSTVEFINNIMLQLPKYYEQLQSEIILGEDKQYQSEYNCSTSKKENLTHSICFRNMLSQIPSISINIASVYVDKYHNMENFINTLNNLSNKNKYELIKILGDEQYGKLNRRVGEKTAEKIFSHLFNESDYSLEIPIKVKKTKSKTTKTSKKNNLVIVTDPTVTGTIVTGTIVTGTTVTGTTVTNPTVTDPTVTDTIVTDIIIIDKKSNKKTVNKPKKQYKGHIHGLGDTNQYLFSS